MVTKPTSEPRAFKITLALIALAYLTVLVALPVIAVFIEAFSKGTD